MKGEYKIHHLSNILNVITRMGSNSFALKGWALGIMIAVYTFGNMNVCKALFVTIVPLIMIWVMDSYYLMIERKFRLLYDYVRDKNTKETDFSMDYNSVSIKLGNAKKLSLFNAMFSKTIIPFYLVCIAVTVVLYCL